MFTKINTDIQIKFLKNNRNFTNTTQKSIQSKITLVEPLILQSFSAFHITPQEESQRINEEGREEGKEEEQGKRNTMKDYFFIKIECGKVKYFLPRVVKYFKI